MPSRRLNILLLLVFLLLLGLTWWDRPNMGRTNFELLPDMAHSPAYGAFSPNPNFPDGKTLQQPVRGTIARGYPPLHYAATPAGAARAGEELRNPFAPGNAAALERGTAVFATFCQPCHGPGGAGNGMVIARGYPAPPSLLAANAVNMKDGRLFHVLTYGQGNMPPYAAQLSREDRWKAILFVRGLQEQAGARRQP